MVTDQSVCGSAAQWQLPAFVCIITYMLEGASCSVEQPCTVLVPRTLKGATHQLCCAMCCDSSAVHTGQQTLQ